jgi:hypothetical protein
MNMHLNLAVAVVSVLPLLACGNPSTNGNDGDPSEDSGTESGDGDGDTQTGDGDGDTQTGDGDGDGDTQTGDGDGDGDDTCDGQEGKLGCPCINGLCLGDLECIAGTCQESSNVETAMVRMVHLSSDLGPVDAYLDGEQNPLWSGLSFEQGVSYLQVPVGDQLVYLTPEGQGVDDAIATIDAQGLEQDLRYSMSIYGYADTLGNLVLWDDDADLDPAMIRVQVSHVAPDLGQVDLYDMDTDPPVLLLNNFSLGASHTLELPAMTGVLGMDLDNDQVQDRVFQIPGYGGGSFLDLYLVDDYGPSQPMFMLFHEVDGSTVHVDYDSICGDDVVGAAEPCDGDDLGEASTCGDVAPASPFGSLSCLQDCSGYDTSACEATLTVCNDNITPIPADDDNGVAIDVNVDESVTVVDVNLSVDITHPLLSFVNASLAHDQTTVVLWDGVPDTGGGGCIGDDMQVVIDDESMNQFECDEDATPAMMGDYMPELDALAGFDGLGGGGTWTLTVASDFGDHNGTVDNWCIILTGEQP